MSGNGDFQPDKELAKGDNEGRKSIHYFRGERDDLKDHPILKTAAELQQGLKEKKYYSKALAYSENQPFVDALNNALEEAELTDEEVLVFGDNASTPMISEQPTGTIDTASVPYIGDLITEMDSIQGDFCGFGLRIYDIEGDEDQGRFESFAACLCVRVGSLSVEAPNILSGSSFCSVVDFQPGGIQFLEDIREEKIKNSFEEFSKTRSEKINKRIRHIQAIIESDLFDESYHDEEWCDAAIVQEIGVKVSKLLRAKECQTKQFKDALSSWLEIAMQTNSSFVKVATSYALRIDNQLGKNGEPLYHILKKPEKHQYETIEGEIMGIHFLEHYDHHSVGLDEDLVHWDGPLTPYLALSNSDWGGEVLYVALENIQEFMVLDRKI